MQTLKFKLLTTAAACLLGIGTTTHAAVINFEDVAVSAGSVTTDGDITSGGFRFDSSLNHLHRANDATDRASDGSTTLWIHNNGTTTLNSLTLSLLAGGTFSLNSASFAELWADFTGLNATSIAITGNIFGGGTVTTTVTLDGIVDGPGGAGDFQTFAFAGWNNLTSVVFGGVGGDPLEHGWSIDDITVNAVPEPSTYLAGALLALVFGVQGFRSLRNRKQTA